MSERFLLVYRGTQGAQGSQGYIGFMGNQGATGATGAIGFQGISGNEGPIGFQGNIGFMGFMGIQGPSTGAQGNQGQTGTQGASGLTGPQGFEGPRGPQGDLGATGVDGDFGSTGPRGSQGVSGFLGIQGAQGFPGDLLGSQGVQGFQGLAGATGVQGLEGSPGVSPPGSTGPQGYQGVQGTTGATGARGTQGLTVGGALGATGFQGSRGNQGPTGPTGATGVSSSRRGFQGVTQTIIGPTGLIGPQGVQGATGSVRGVQGTNIAGAIGFQGYQGPSAATGVIGPSGATGFQGVQGLAGNRGSQGVQGPTAVQEGPVQTAPIVSNTNTREWTLDPTYQMSIGTYVTPNSAINPISYISTQTTMNTSQKIFGNSSASFGTSGYILVSGLGSAQFSNNWTYECWVRITDSTSFLQGNQTIFSVHSGTRGNLPNIALGIKQTSRLLTLWVSNNGTTWAINALDNSTPLSIENWHHVALGWNGTGYSLYLNGTLQSTTNGTAISPANLGAFLIIGAWYDGNTYSSNINNGQIDELRISSTLRYSSNFTPSTSPFTSDVSTIYLQHFEGANLTSDWNGSQETPIVSYSPQDSSSNILSNRVTYTSTTSFSSTQERFGYASVYFRSFVTDFIKVSNIGSSGFSTSWTIEGWVYPTNLTNQAGGDNQTIFSVGISPTNLNYLFFGLRRSGSNLVTAFAFNASGSVNPASPTVGSTNIVLNTWNHVSLVRDSTNYNVYLNGVLQNSVSGSSIPAQAIGSTIMLGAYVNAASGTESPNQGLNNGFIDEVRISSSIRYSSNFTPSPTAFTTDASTIFLHHFNGPSGSSNWNIGQETPLITYSSQKRTNRLTYSGLASLNVDQQRFGSASAYFITGQYLQVSNFPNNLFSISGGVTTTWTYECWFYITQAVSQTIWSITVNGTSEFMRLAVNASNAIQVFLGSTGSSWNIYNGTTGATISTNTWNHVAITYDSSNYRFYVNGSHQTAVASASRPPLSAFSSGVFFGAYQVAGTGVIGDFLANGYIDEFRISSVARYTGTSSFTPSTDPFRTDANTIFLQHFNGDHGSRRWDLSQETPSITSTNPQIIVNNEGIQSSNVISNELTPNQITEKITTIGALPTTTVELSWLNMNGNIIHVVPTSSNNLTCVVYDVPTTDTNVMYSFSIIVIASRYKVYVTSLVVNGITVAPLFTYGLKRLSISTATLISQTFTLVYTDSSTTPWQCISNVIPSQ